MDEIIKNKGKKGFALMKLSLKIRDVRDATKLIYANPFRVYEYLLEYQELRKNCKKQGIDLSKFDSIISDITSKLKFTPLYR